MYRIFYLTHYGGFRLMGIIWVLLLNVLGTGESVAQSSGSNASFNFETSVTTLTACGSTAQFRVKVTSVVGLTGNTFSISMPNGLEYVPTASSGGLTIISGTGTITENSISNLSLPTFTIGNLTAGQVLEFTYTVRANCSIIPFIEALNTPFINFSFVSASPARTETFQTVGFNVLYGVPSITDVLTNNVSTAGYIGNIGDVVQRKVIIKNGGNGAITTETFLELDGSYTHSSIGGPYSAGATLSGSRLSLSTAAFGPDGVWSSDETIEVTYLETITNCPVGTPSRNIYAGYGCNSTDCKVTQTKATQLSTPYLPNVQMRAEYNTVVCPGEEPYITKFTIVNKGQGTARNFSLLAYNLGFETSYYDLQVFIDTAGVTYTRNGGVPIHPYATDIFQREVPATNRLCNPGVASTSVGGARFNLGDLAPGDSIVMTVQGNACLSSLCQPLKHTAFIGYGRWTSGCSETFVEARITNTNNIANGNAFVDVLDTGEVKIQGNNQPIQIGMAYGNYFISNIANGGYLNVCVNVPAGLLLDETQTDSYVITDANNPAIMWRPSSYVRTGNTICYTFSHSTLPAGFSFGNLLNQQFKLSQDCSNGSGVLPLSFTYTVKNSDACALEHQVACYTREVVSLCPSPPCPQGGLITVSTGASRKNYGKADNNNDGVPDVNGALDFSRITTTQYLLGDTMRYTYKGVIAGTSDPVTYPLNSQFEYAYLNAGIPTSGTAAHFKLLGNAQITVKKVSGPIVTCAAAAIASAASFSLQLNNCPALSGYILQPGDSILVEQFLQTVSTKVMASQAVVATTGYASHVLNPDATSQFGCGISFDRYRVSGFIVNSGAANFSVSCDGNLATVNSGGFRSNIFSGTSAGNYGFGNAFPFEYRSVTVPNKIKVLLPTGYVYNQGSIRFLLGPNAAQSFFPLPAPIVSVDTLVFDLSSIYKPNGGTLDYPDEGFDMSLTLAISQLCGTPPGNAFIRSAFEVITPDSEVARLLVQANPPVGSDFTTYAGNLFIKSTGSSIVNSRVPLNLTSIVTTSNSEDGNVSYRLRLSNDGSEALANTWIHGNNTSINITQIIDETTNTALTPDANGFFRLGDYAPGLARSYTVRGTLSQCEPASDLIFAGSCGAYPTTLASACAKDTLTLTANPGDTDFQTILTGPNAQVSLCEDADFSFDVKASKLGNVKDMAVNFQLPNGSSIVPGSVTYSYPADATASIAPNPASLTGSAVFNVAGYSSQLTNVGLRGVGTVDADSSVVRVSFKVRTDCNYSPGSVFRASYFANNACGTALDPRSNTADLSIPDLGVLPYRTTVLLVSPDVATCTNTPVKMVVQVTNVAGGTATGSNDSIYVELPPNVSFSSYIPAANGGDYLNAPVIAPRIYGIAGGYTRVSFLMPAGVPAGSNINFPFNYSLNASALLCNLDSVKVYTGVANITGCSSAPGGSCTVLVLNSIVPGRAIPQYQPDATFAYGASRYCGTDTAPAPAFVCNTSSALGTFSAPAGLSINPTTGVIDPATSVSGTYLVTYNIPSSGSSCLGSQDTTTVIINGGSCALPVTLISFTAVKEMEAGSPTAALAWTTTSEVNSERFEIERSITGKAWSRIGVIRSHGESIATLNYFFKDKQPLDGDNLYRLKMIDKDQSFTYSRIVSLGFENNSTSVFPNPSTDRIEIRSTDWSQVTKVEIYNQAGRVLYQSPDKPSRTIDIRSMSNGIYQVQVTLLNGTKSNYKFVIAR